MQGIPDALSPEAEAKLARNICDHPCERDINKLVLHNLREAVPYTLRCCRNALSESEVLSVCYAALCKAAPNYRPGGPLRFFSYAKPYLRGELSRNWKTKDVVKSASLHESEAPPLMHSTLNSGAEEGDDDFHKKLEKPLQPDSVEPEFDLIDLREQMALLRPLLQSKLNERERTVITLVYESGFTLEQVSKLVVPSASRQAIQCTHQRALKKLRSALSRTGALL